MLFLYNPTAGKGQLPDELAAVLEAARALDVESLVRACVEGRRVTKITAASG